MLAVEERAAALLADPPAVADPAQHAVGADQPVLDVEPAGRAGAAGVARAKISMSSGWT